MASSKFHTSAGGGNSPPKPTTRCIRSACLTLAYPCLPSQSHVHLLSLFPSPVCVNLLWYCVESHAGSPPPDTSDQYYVQMLKPLGSCTLVSESAAANLEHILESPLGRKLPASSKVAAIIQRNANILTYVEVNDTAADSAYNLALKVSSSLVWDHGPDTSASEYSTAFKTMLLVDVPLKCAARALGLPVRVERNVVDNSGATGNARGG
jgi:hypothetical protein